MSEKLKEFFKNFEIKEICHICEDSGFYLHIGDEVPSFSCMREDTKRKFDCYDYSGFNMKNKRDWYKFRVANTNTCLWEIYRTANYEDGAFEDLDEVEVVAR